MPRSPRRRWPPTWKPFLQCRLSLRWRPPLRWRLALPFVAVVLVTMVGLSLYLSQQIRETRQAEYEARLQAEARLLGSWLRAAPYTQTTVAGWASALGARVTLIGADGAVLADSAADAATMENHLGRPEVQQALLSSMGSSIRYSTTLGERLLYVALYLPDRPDGVAFVRLALPLSEIAARVAELQNALLLATAVASLLIVSLAFLIAGWLTRPLRQLVADVRALPAGQGATLAQSASYDEVRDLAAAFQAMTSELQARFDSLAQERNKLATVLSHLADGVLITDATGRVTMANPAALRLLGSESKGEDGTTALDELVSEPHIFSAWRQARRTGRPHEAMIEPAGKDTMLHVLASPLQNAPFGPVLLVLQDLSQVRRLESVRRDFISNISHELRTPLASLKALVETLRDGAIDEPEVASDFLQRMEVEVDALTQMVQELLELSRIESGQAPIRPEPVTLDEILSGPVERLRLQAERAGLSLDLHLPPEDALVLADLERIKQVVTNLVHNAIKFTPSGGHIEVAARVSGSEVIVSVADTGIGIAAQDMPRVFERFYKADRARSGGGTGLGLAIAKHVVQGHGGRIWVESREGKGSTFYFTLPLVQG